MTLFIGLLTKDVEPTWLHVVQCEHDDIAKISREVGTINMNDMRAKAILQHQLSGAGILGPTMRDADAVHVIWCQNGAGERVEWDVLDGRLRTLPQRTKRDGIEERRCEGDGKDNRRKGRQGGN